MRDERIVYGVNCVWWDDISKVGKIPTPSGHNLPCCPYCKSVLMQIEEPNWWEGVDEHEEDGHPGYRALIEWQRGKCFKSMEEAEQAFKGES